jgi:hypothetical protein
MISSLLLENKVLSNYCVNLVLQQEMLTEAFM